MTRAVIYLVLLNCAPYSDDFPNPTLSEKILSLHMWKIFAFWQLYLKSIQELYNVFKFERIKGGTALIFWSRWFTTGRPQSRPR